MDSIAFPALLCVTLWTILIYLTIHIWKGGKK